MYTNSAGTRLSEIFMAAARELLGDIEQQNDVRSVDIEAVAHEQQILRARFLSLLYEDDSILSRYAYWVLRRGHGTLSVLPLDVRRIIIRYVRTRFRRAVPLERIVERCRAAGDKKMTDYVRSIMSGRAVDAIYRSGQDYREWAL